MKVALFFECTEAGTSWQYLIAKSVWQTLQLVTTVNFVVDAGLTKRQRESSVSDVSSFLDSKRV